MSKLVLRLLITGAIGLAFAVLGKHYFGVSDSWVTINVGLPSSQPDYAGEDARRAAEAKRQEDEARRKQEERLAGIRRDEERARAEVDANRRRLEAARAAEEVEAANRRMREAVEAEKLAKARRVQEWRNANGGCDPPLRRQCTTMGSSGGGPRQILGCSCVR